ncbi:MAG: 16S rRNA (guanine(527)-N(7))-methyltransferase RsmG [Bacteroidota bacterium]
MEIIQKYYPDLTQHQIDQFAELKTLYTTWNEMINVISRKDMDHFYEHHVLHSLGIAKFIRFAPSTTLLDVGTGGGFPGIPLAILFPECQFHLVDSKAKKIKVVNDVIAQLNLNNVRAEHARAEELKSKYDFIISRAVTRMEKFYEWVRPLIGNNNKNGLPNGILYLKGGDLTEELRPVPGSKTIFDLSEKFEEPFFETKKVVYIQA